MLAQAVRWLGPLTILGHGWCDAGPRGERRGLLESCLNVLHCIFWLRVLGRYPRDDTVRQGFSSAGGDYYEYEQTAGQNDFDDYGHIFILRHRAERCHNVVQDGQDTVQGTALAWVRLHPGQDQFRARGVHVLQDVHARGEEASLSSVGSVNLLACCEHGARASGRNR